MCSQLAQTNKRFTYSRIAGEGSRQSRDEYSENLLWMENAGYGNFVQGLYQPVEPLEMNESRDAFKVYSDTGMLGAHLSDDSVQAIRNGDSAFNAGAITENVVAECLVKCGFSPRYYANRNGINKMELDFVISINGKATAIEVKSGKSRDASSINKAGDIFELRRIKLDDTNIFCDESETEHYPMFASAFLDSLNESDFRDATFS